MKKKGRCFVLKLRDITESTNRWLTFKRQTADNPEELPTEKMVLEKLNELFEKSIERSNITKNAVYDWAKKYGLDVKEAEPENVALLEIVSDGNYIPTVRQEDAEFIKEYKGRVTFARLGSWTTDGNVGVLETIYCWALLHKNAGETSYVNSIMELPSVLVSEQDYSVWDVIVRAMNIQMQRGEVSLQRRWAAAPYSFRRKHCICPKCGSSIVRHMQSWDESERWLGCDDCGWTAHDKAIVETWDLIEEGSFLKEVQFVEKQEEAERKLLDSIKRAKQESAELSKLVTQYRKGYLPDGDMIKSMESIVEDLHKAIETMRGLSV